jgi:putative endonuclease
MKKDLTTTIIVTTTALGKKAESEAQSYLELRGYQLVEKNFRWKGGEIDLVMIEKTIAGSILVFVEVRSAKNSSSFLKYSVGYSKQRRLTATAYVYSLRRKWAKSFAKRFDMIWIQAKEIEHWRNVHILV